MNTDNLPLYSAFLAVAKSGSILGAARQLYISQPAVSKAIKKLETNLNTTLFVRTSKGVQLTEEGSLLYASINSAFEYIDAGESGVLSRNNLGIGHIRIGASTTLCKYILLPYLSKFTVDHPHISISIECQSSGETLSLLQDGAIDIGLVAKTDTSKPFTYYELGYIHDTFIATPSYIDGLSARMGKANILLLNKENITRQYVDSHMNSDFFVKNNILEIDNMNLLIDFAKAGIGIGCAIKEFVADELSNNKLLEYRKDLPIFPARQVCFATFGKRNTSPHVSGFLDYISREDTILSSHK